MMMQLCDDRIEILAPAKINVFLEILGKRQDGFHELETVMSPVSIYDSLVLSPRTDSRLILNARWSRELETSLSARDRSLPPPEQNLVFRALAALREKAGCNRGVDVELIKRIPAQAGLGGASSDAAAALKAGNQLWRLGLTAHELAELAAGLGSDVSFFLGTRPAVCRGRGERIEPLHALPPLAVVLVRPPEGLSTPAVYQRCQIPESPEDSARLIHSWRQGNLVELGRQLINRLQAAAAGLSEWMTRLQRAFADACCPGYLMTGSGSTWFGICHHARHARAVAARLRSQLPGWVSVGRAGALFPAD
jgi:4-diphosphocytidyl-2-C-methyl-D-erythritol kinase